MIQNTLRTPIKLHVPVFLACARFLLSRLPSRASAPSLFAGLRLLSPLHLRCCVASARLCWLVLVCPCGVVCCVFFVWWFVWCLFVVLSPLFALVGFSSCPTGQMRCLSCFTCTTKALIYPSTYVSDRRLGRFTRTFDFHRFTMFLLLLLCDFPQCTKVTKDGWQLLTNDTHPPL